MRHSRNLENSFTEEVMHKVNISNLSAMNTNIDLAYAIQRKYLKNKDIYAYKVGASNLSSKNFFSATSIIIGGIEQKNIYKDKIKKNYPIAELEIAIKVRYDSKAKTKIKILNYYVAIECPSIDIENKEGSEFICIADNCSSGDLILLDKVDNISFDKFNLIISGEDYYKNVVNADMNRLVYSIDTIINQTIDLIEYHKLPFNNEFYISTGGVSDIFSLKPYNTLTLNYE